MGFYGNITNTTRTQFQFDKIYPNRYEMDKLGWADGVYIGRFVLVEYDDEYHLDTFTRVTMNNGIAYLNGINGVLITKSMIELNDIVYTTSSPLTPDTGLAPKDCVFYKCTSAYSVGSTEPATFIAITQFNGTAYTDNYHIDLNTYGTGRGYDSTVWQKVYTDGREKYVMVAELNSVVPTFAISTDAPTMNPVEPHFDLSSTDVYYKLHWQTPWGFRIGSNDNYSDAQTVWTTTTYNQDTGKNNTTTATKNAAIYFNKAGFNPRIRTKVENAGVDEIKVVPVSSGQKIYNNHNAPGTTTTADDIQEMTINLPGIGNMMSDAWDIIHGINRNDDMRQYDENGVVVESLQGRLDSIAAINANEIPVKRASDGRLVGTKINGDNNKLDSEIPEILAESLSTNLTEDDAWIYTKINSNAVTDEHNNGIAIHHTYHPTESSTSSVNKNDASTTTSAEYKTNHLATENLTAHKDKINLYVPYVDAAGHVVGENIETITLPYSYRTYTTSGLEASTNDLYTSITEDANGAHTSAANANSSQTIADETQDSIEIAPGNKWIQTKFENDKLTIAHEIHAIPVNSHGTTNANAETGAANENNINIPDWNYDKAGHIIAKHDHFYTLPFGFKTIKTNGRSNGESENATSVPVTTDVVADATQDILSINSGNKWIRIDSDAANDSFTISHDVHNTSSTTSTQSLVSETEATTFKVPTYAFDTAGHYTSHDTKTITMPFGYGKVAGDNGKTSATATFDELTFASDEWLTATVTKDTVTYSHDYPKKVNDTNSTSNVNGNGDTIVLETLERDEKGHVIKVNQNTVTLPYGYKTFKDSNNTVGESIASNTQDVFVFKGDNWIKPTVSNDLAVFEHIGPVTGTYTSKDNVEPKFGDTFTIEDHYYDDNGHIFNTETHTVKIPKGSLADEAATGSDVITQLNFVDTSGALSTTRTNISNLKLTDYSKGSNNADIAATDLLGEALSKLQTQIHDTETVISNLDYDEIVDNTTIITRIAQTDGKITSVDRAAAGTLVLGNNYSKATASAALTASDSLNTAFGKIEKSLEETNTRITDLIGGDNLNTAFDTLKEVSDWLEANDSGADQIIDSIAILNGADTVEGSVAHSITQAITTEVDDRNTAIDNKINTLNVVDTAVSGQYVSAVSEKNGKVTVSREALPTYTLTPGSANGTVAFNGADVAITGLGSAAYTSSDAYDRAGAAQAVQDQLQKYPTIEQRFSFNVKEVPSRFEYTIEELFTIVAVMREQTRIMHQEISELRSEIDKLKNQ